MIELGACLDIPYHYLVFYSETHSYLLSIKRPIDTSNLGLASSLIFRLKVDDLLKALPFDYTITLLLILRFLMQNEVIFQVSVIRFPQMWKLVDVLVGFQGVVLVQVEASDHLLGEEVHDEHIGIFTPDGN